MIKFIEHHEPSYANRTIANAKVADLTIAFAVDFKTPGEILTHKASYGKYFPIVIENYINSKNDISSQVINDLVNYIFDRDIKVINIAGNGIYTLKIEQSEIDDYIFKYLQPILECFNIPFIIRSGGQTGIDEAALKAGDKLGLDCICLAPKNWLFRDINGKDHMHDPEAFCARFGEQYINNI